MNRNKYYQLRAIVTCFISLMVAVAAISSSYLLAITSVSTGLMFLLLVRFKAKITIDEREIAIQEKAAKMAYAIFAPTIGIGSFLLLIPSRSGLSVFSKGEFNYLESLGLILAYLTLFLISIYAISYYFLNHRYGGSGEK